MQTQDIEKFEKLWNAFSKTVKGKLLTYSKDRPLTGGVARLVLSEASSAWFSDYEVCGRWLLNLRKEQPQLGSDIEKVLCHSMTFTDLPETNQWPIYLDIALPLVGAGAGWAVSYMLDGSKAVQWVSALATAVLTYSACRTIGGMSKDRNKDTAIDSYMQQLTTYHDQVISLLQMPPQV